MYPEVYPGRVAQVVYQEWCTQGGVHAGGRRGRAAAAGCRSAPVPVGAGAGRTAAARIARSQQYNSTRRFCAKRRLLTILGVLAGTRALLYPAWYTLLGTPASCTAAAAITSLITGWSILQFWRLVRSRTWSSWAANIPLAELTRAARSASQRRLSSRSGHSPGPGRPESPETPPTIPARLIPLLRFRLSGTNWNKVVPRYFTHHNRSIGETFQNGGY